MKRKRVLIFSRTPSFPESTAFEWGSGGNGGIVSYQYPSDKRPDTNNDMLSLGFITPSFDAVLARVDSHPDSNHDFLELEIVSNKLIIAMGFFI